MEHLIEVKDFTDTCVAFGTFDGMHRGHLAVIDALVAHARKMQKKSIVVSSELHMRSALTTEAEKMFLLKDSGVDILLSLPADDSIDGKTTSALVSFVRETIIGTLGAQTIVVEQNDNTNVLQTLADSYGVKLIVVPAVPSSPTDGNIRQLLLQHNLPAMRDLLGHPYLISGTIVQGNMLGRTVNMPTANLACPPQKLKPPNGVYASLTHIEGEAGVHIGATNIGTRPTIDQSQVITIETFMINFNRNIYDQNVIIEIHDHVRGVQKFENLAAVKKQVLIDLEKAQDILGAKRKNFIRVNI